MARNAVGTAERPRLTRELIVEAAITLVERDGAKALSMRKVAAELDVGVMSLYNHVEDRDALLAGVAQKVLAGLEVSARARDPDEDWRVAARAVVRAFQGMARRYPRSMQLVLTSGAGLPLWWEAGERALTFLEAVGFDGETSVRTLRALMAYTIGSQTMAAGALKVPDIQIIRAEPERFPHTAALADELLLPDPEADFACGLELLLSALDGLLRTTRGRPA